ncbi:MAG: ImmA/IrrE family metallo-endopeptidase [Culicoidibacterales bacterium]
MYTNEQVENIANKLFQFLDMEINMNYQALKAHLLGHFPDMLTIEETTLTHDAELDHKDNYIIRINKEHREQRQKFSLAHEFAHLVLHTDFLKVLTGKTETETAEFPFLRSKIGGRKEIEANKFAAEFLLPKELFLEKYDLKCDCDDKESKTEIIQALASEFYVSQHFVEVRGKNLGIW